MEWISHAGTERTIASHVPIEARLRDGSVVRNRAGNFDNWRWRETGPDCIERYRLIGEEELPRWLRPTDPH